MNNKNLNPRFYVYDFCNGELCLEESFDSSTLVDIFLTRNSLEDPLIIYGYNLTNYFVKK